MSPTEIIFEEIREALDYDLWEKALKLGMELYELIDTGEDPPEFPPGRLEGNQWWIVYIEALASWQDGEIISTMEDGRGDFISIHETCQPLKTFSEAEEDVTHHAYHVDSQGFVYTYTLTPDELEALRQEYGQ